MPNPANFRALKACCVLAVPLAAVPGAFAAAPSEIGIPGQGVYPESITSTADGRLIIGSIAYREILQVKPGEAIARSWIKADADTHLGVFGVFADDKSNTLWACFSAYPGSGGPAPSVLASFDLASGKPKARHVLPGKETFCNDIAVGPDGSAYVSDSDAMQIDRLPRGGAELEVWAGNGAFGAKGGILDGISVLGRRVVVNALQTEKVFEVPIGTDGKAGKVSEVKLSRAIAQPDGMRAFGKDSVLLVESGGTGRLSKLVLGADGGRLTTLKEGYPQGPVSVAVVGRTAYVLEGQLDVLFGEAKTPRKDEPFHATAVDVGAP